MSDKLLEPGDEGPRQLRIIPVDPFNFGSSLHMYRRIFDGIEVAQPGDWVTIKTGERLPDKPLMNNLSRTELQMLMDGLYDMGIRPTHEVSTNASIEHVKEHLKDMRSIAFNRLNIDK